MQRVRQLNYPFLTAQELRLSPLTCHTPWVIVQVYRYVLLPFLVSGDLHLILSSATIFCKESACTAGDVGLLPGWEDPLEEGMATHISILAWRIPWTEEPGGLQSMVSQRVRHDWSDSSGTHNFLVYLSFVLYFEQRVCVQVLISRAILTKTFSNITFQKKNSSKQQVVLEHVLRRKLIFALFRLFRNEIFSPYENSYGVHLSYNSQNTQLVDISKCLFCIV